MYRVIPAPYTPPAEYTEMLDQIAAIHAERRAPDTTNRRADELLQKFWEVDAARIAYLGEHPEVTKGILGTIGLSC